MPRSGAEASASVLGTCYRRYMGLLERLAGGQVPHDAHAVMAQVAQQAEAELRRPRDTPQAQAAADQRATQLGAAVAHLVYHASWLRLTAYLPALVGTLHATHGFLRLPQLLAQHQEMLAFLEDLKPELEAQGAEAAALVTAAEQLLRRIEHADDLRLGVAVHQDLHPV